MIELSWPKAQATTIYSMIIIDYSNEKIILQWMIMNFILICNPLIINIQFIRFYNIQNAFSPPLSLDFQLIRYTL